MLFPLLEAINKVFITLVLKRSLSTMFYVDILLIFNLYTIIKKLSTLITNLFTSVSYLLTFPFRVSTIHPQKKSGIPDFYILAPNSIALLL